MAIAVMSVDDFLYGCESYVGRSKYALGFFGYIMTQSALNSKKNDKNTKKWYNDKSCIDKSKTNYEYLSQFTNGNWYGTDCVCLLKGVLWGYNGYGKVGKYASNGVKDMTDQAFYDACYDKMDISGVNNPNRKKLVPGMILHMNGHVGTVKSNENGVIKVIESAPTLDGTQISDIGYQEWTGAGYSPYINYEKKPQPTPSPAPAIITAGSIVKIVEGAVYGGSSYGVKVPSAYIGQPYTVVKVETHNNEEEALIKELNSWVATKYLVLVESDKIEVGSTVTIVEGAVYGGLSSSRGTKVPEGCIGVPYIVSAIENHKGDDEALLKELNSWVALKYLKIYLTSVQKPNYPVKTVWVDDLNVRYGPGTYYRVERMVHRGTKFTVYETKGDWSRVGKNEWVYSKYIK